MPYTPKDRYEKLIQKAVEGGIKVFLDAHPEVAEAWTGKLSPGKTKAMAVTDSLAKRITRGLTAPQKRGQIEAALNVATAPRNWRPEQAPEPGPGHKATGPTLEKH